MSLIPEFELGLLNAWIFVVPWLLLHFGLTLSLKSFIRDRKSTFWAFPSYTRLERMYLLLWYVIFGGLLIYSVFLPLAIGTVWFYAGLSVYLLGIAFVVLAMWTFTATPVDKPNITGVYRISRHPWYLGMFFMYIGTGIVGASWVFLLLVLIWLAPTRNVLMIPEERQCCERFGNAYREYMDRTPRWIGIPKSEKRE